MNVMKQMTNDVYVMGKSKKWNQDSNLDISKPWISWSLVEVPHESRYSYFTIVYWADSVTIHFKKSTVWPSLCSLKISKDYLLSSGNNWINDYQAKES